MSRRISGITDDYFWMCPFFVSSEPSSPNFPSETTTSISSPSETLKAPSEPSLSPISRTSEKEAQRDGEVEVAPEGETEEEKAKRLLYCSLCKVAVNSASQLQAHNSGEGTSSSSCPRCVWPSADMTLCLLRHQTQDHAGGKEWGWSHQILPQDGGKGQVGHATWVVNWAPEQDFPLWDLWRARKLGDSAQTGWWVLSQAW